jgi:hypothetical protein
MTTGQTVRKPTMKIRVGVRAGFLSTVHLMFENPDFQASKNV